MKKVLIVASVVSFIEWFNRDNVSYLVNEIGCELHVACNFDYTDDTDKTRTEEYINKLKNDGVILHNIRFNRSPFGKGNFSAYGKLKRLIRDECFDLIHCHTPTVSAMTRLAARKARKRGCVVMYTCHGFHFYKGASILKWLMFYPIEKLLSYVTDVMLTINTEDYEFSKKKMHPRKLTYIPGNGVDITKFRPDLFNREEKRAELGIPSDAKLLVSVGELNDNKNHATVIKAIADMDAYYIIAGCGDKKDELQKLIDEEGLSERVKLLGFRNDVGSLYVASDVFVFPSFREGLSVSLMEAMATGLPCAVSRIRGNVDLIDDCGGRLFDPRSVDECRQAIAELISTNETNAISEYNKEKIKGFSSDNVNRIVFEEYSLILRDNG